MVALAPGNEMPTLRLADLDEILAGELQRRFDRFRATGNDVRMRHAGRRVRDQVIGELFRDFRGEEAGVGIGDPVELCAHRRRDVGVAMTETGHGRAAGRVEVFLSVGVDDDDAVAADGHRQRRSQMTVKDVRHSDSLMGKR